jgi:miniconductance mechanosensitive channel
MNTKNINHWFESIPEGAERILKHFNIEITPLISLIIALFLIVVIAIITHLIMHRLVSVIRAHLSQSSDEVWKKALVERYLFKRAAFTIQAIIIQIQAGLWLAPGTLPLLIISTASRLWIIVFSLLTLYSVIDTLRELAGVYPSTRNLPLRGISQGSKLLLALVAIVLAISTIIGKSPLYLFSGLGAMTAVLMLVFKDTIMGFVAGVQLFANRMLAVGDWLEMNKYGANGSVIEITLTSVKVQNWDNTITTIPTYALISDSFKNWQGMQESGGRRITKNILIDVSSVHFLSDEEIKHLRKISILTDYIDTRPIDTKHIGTKPIDTKSDENKSNKANQSPNQAPGQSPTQTKTDSINSHQLTNLGIFRVYLRKYLQNHPSIHKEMTLMARQLEPESKGIPIQIYAFSNTTEWLEYEQIQGDILDHVLAIVPEFGLRVFQLPTGYDMRIIGTTDHTGVMKIDT